MRIFWKVVKVSKGGIGVLETFTVHLILVLAGVSEDAARWRLASNHHCPKKQVMPRKEFSRRL